MLIKEFAGGVVVLDRKARARKAVIIRRLLSQRQGRSDAGMAEIANADLGRIGRERMRRDDAKADHADPAAEHGSSLIDLLALDGDGGSHTACNMTEKP
jgi:hypothetical protein